MPSPLWEDAKRVCEDLGSTVNVEIVRFLERLVRDHPAPPSRERPSRAPDDDG